MGRLKCIQSYMFLFKLKKTRLVLVAVLGVAPVSRAPAQERPAG
jgi:hypothetical protein